MLGNGGMGQSGEEDRIESVLMDRGKDSIFTGPQVGNRGIAEEAEDDREAS
jgi:hypothetical protein